MQKYFCDICETELPADYTRTPRQPGSPSAICGANDLCPSCAFIEEQINVKELIEQEWRRLVDEKAKEREEPSFSGRGRLEKQEIFNRLSEYRRKNGSGSFKPVAELSGLTVDGLYQMMSGKPVSLAIWRKAGEALNQIEGNC